MIVKPAPDTAPAAPATPPPPTAAARPPEPREAVPCPLCEYDLRGLAEPRCPECGYRFTWDELSDPTRRFHPYLFEHHPERNTWSFVRTLTRGLSPARFWSTLYPAQPSRPRRLVAYWVLCALPLAAAAVVLAWLNVSVVLTAMRGRPRAGYGIRQVAQWAANYDIRGGAVVLVAFMCLAWPWLTLGALLIFQISLRRARLRSIHVLRCVLYAGDVTFWCAGPLALVALFTWARPIWPPQSPLGDAWPVVPAALALWLTYRLFIAYRLYLRFDHALATVLASQVIVALVYLKLWFFVQGI